MLALPQTPQDTLREEIETGLRMKFEEVNGHPVIWAKQAADVIMQIIRKREQEAAKRALDEVVLNGMEDVQWSVPLIDEEKNRVLAIMFPTNA